MSIAPISPNNTSAITSTQLFNNSSINSGSQDSDGDNDGSRVSNGRGKFASAISQALSQLGVSTGDTSSTASTSNASSTTSTQDPQSAVTSFMQSLFAALHASSPANASNTSQVAAGNDSDGDNDGSTTSAVSGAAGKGHHHHGGGAHKLESDLQNLIQQVTSASNASTTGSSTPGSTSSNPNLDALQQGFNSLLSASGVSGSSATTLSSFLQSLSQSMQGATATGNIVTTKV